MRLPRDIDIDRRGTLNLCSVRKQNWILHPERTTSRSANTADRQK